MSRPKKDGVYFTDNGRVACYDHLGMTAQSSGRDISGQRIVEITPDVFIEADRMSKTNGIPADKLLSCETCGRAASRLHSSNTLMEGRR